MNKKIWTILKYLIFLSLGLFLLWYTVKDFDEKKWNQLIFDLSHANYWLLIPVFFIMVMSHFLRAIRWKQLIQPLGYNPSLLNCFLCVFIGYWANLAVPRLGEVLKCTFLGRYEKITVDKLIGTIVVERAVDVIALLILFIITIGIQIEVLGNYTVDLFCRAFQNHSGHFSIIRLSVVIAIGVAIFFCIRYALQRYKHIPIIQKIKTILRGIIDGVLAVQKLKHKWWFVLYTIGIWLMYLLSIKLGFLSITETSHLNYAVALSVLVFGAVGMIVPSPGGVGSYQFAVQQILLLYAISEEKGMSVGMLLWFSLTAILIVFGTISFFLLPIVNKKRMISK